MATTELVRGNGRAKEWILYSSKDGKVVLIDIPGSIARWTCLEKTLLSTEPLKIPYVLPEPKSEKGKTAVPEELQKTYDELKGDICDALQNIRANFVGHCWCLPREVMATTKQYTPLLPAELEENLNLLASFAPPTSSEDHVTIGCSNSRIHCSEAFDISDIFNHIVHNTSAASTKICAQVLDTSHSFIVPAKSSFLLSNIQYSLQSFSAYASSVKSFDFVLIDPPWPNRSVLRCQHAYKAVSNVESLLNLPLRNHLRPNGLVGIWITNNHKWKRFVLDKMFPRWNLDFVGQWIWAKVTVLGQPIFDLESLNRKPYETLLFGRRQRGGENFKISTKVLVAVPDLHSRKPCIKDLIDPYLPENYTACEIFGRHLVEGWFTWGKEAIKFNSEQYWR